MLQCNPMKNVKMKKEFQNFEFVVFFYNSPKCFVEYYMCMLAMLLLEKKLKMLTFRMAARLKRVLASLRRICSLLRN